MPDVALTPDGHRYLAAARGRRLPMPFHLRWLVPKVCGGDARRWLIVNRAALAVLPTACTLWVLQSHDWRYALAAPALLMGLTGVAAFNARWPVLVDLPAMALAMCATALVGPCWPAALALIVAAGATKETAPLFAAAWAWNPLLLVGLAAPIARRAFTKPGTHDVLDEHNQWILDHPVTAALRYHAGFWWNWKVMLAPWGLTLLALWNPGPALVCALILGYAQLLVATDTARLYQWAAPAMVAAALWVPPTWLLPIVVFHTFNPWRGDGG